MRRLKSFDDVRRLLANVINKVEDGTMTPKVSGAITFSANVLLRAIECRDLEDLSKRMVILEEKGGRL